MTRGVVYVNMLLTEQVNPTTHAQRAVEGESTVTEVPLIPPVIPIRYKVEYEE